MIHVYGRLDFEILSTIRSMPYVLGVFDTENETYTLLYMNGPYITYGFVSKRLA